MSKDEIECLVKSANNLIDALRIETDYDTENAFWEFEEDDIKWVEAETLMELSLIANEFSTRCKNLADAMSAKT